jgi:hypothetical protein
LYRGRVALGLRATQPTDHLVAAGLYLGKVAVGLLRKRAHQPTDSIGYGGLYLGNFALGLLKKRAHQPTDCLVAEGLYLGRVALGLLKKRAQVPKARQIILKEKEMRSPSHSTSHLS